ncbi:MAG: Crp/Fnr family transcriptional regulator [Bacteroidetes bacterium]|nr:Crp/Fnr family transcriptional regulator [Bacteroidota bacterium]
MPERTSGIHVFCISGLFIPKTQLIFKDARARIIDFLKESATKRGRQVGFEVLFKHCLTQQDIANQTDISRQTITSVFNELRKENLIYSDRNSILMWGIGKLS